MRRVSICSPILIVILFSAWSLSAQGQQEEHPHGEPGHHEGLHFSHPLIAESVSPDTKIRIDYTFVNLADDATKNAFLFEGEYAFHRSFSIEAGVPFETLDPGVGSSMSNFGNAEIAFKFANFAFEDRGLLLGYGIELGLPTGNDAEGIGSDHIFEFEPFFNIGYQREGFEVVSFVTFGIPTNQEDAEEVKTEFRYNFASLYHANPRLQLMLELDGEAVLSGDEAGESEWHLTPGLKVAPANSDLFIGFGVRISLSDNSELDAQALVSLFYHF